MFFKFLDAKLNYVGAIYEIMLHIDKLPIYWSSKVPKCYKQNGVIYDLHRGKKISNNLNLGVSYKIEQFRRAD